MIGDLLLIQEKHRRLAGPLAAAVMATNGRRPVVAIAGESGTGKSEIAHELSRALKAAGRPAKTLHLDDYYRVAPLERTAWRQSHGLAAVGEGEIDWELLERHVDAFRAGASATLPCIDLMTDQIDELTTDFGPVAVLLVEGLYALRVAADLRVYIDRIPHEAEAAQRLRGKEAQTPFRTRVMEREGEVVRATRVVADLIVTRALELVEAGPT